MCAFRDGERGPRHRQTVFHIGELQLLDPVNASINRPESDDFSLE